MDYVTAPTLFKRKKPCTDLQARFSADCRTTSRKQILPGSRKPTDRLFLTSFSECSTPVKHSVTLQPCVMQTKMETLQNRLIDL